MTLLGDAPRANLDAAGVVTSDPRGTAVARVGDAEARLLAGPPADSGAEPLSHHLDRLGALPSSRGGPSDGRELIEASGLLGRGGGEFPLAVKLAAAARSALEPVVVVNASEGEPASRKDQTLLALRPHLVLDGAAFLARVVGANSVSVYAEPGRRASWMAMQRAFVERFDAGLIDPEFIPVVAPARYVTGESTAVVNRLNGRPALPSKYRRPVAEAGVGGRPTLVCNTETVAHLGLIARHGADWFRQAGSELCPGSTLLTIAGESGDPGRVVELLQPVTGGELLAAHGGFATPPVAVLVGGYAGRFVRGEGFFGASVERSALRRRGLPLGCGLVAPIGPSSCGLETTLSLLTYLASESAKQCGTCMFGLPRLQDDLRSLCDGAPRSVVRRLMRTVVTVAGQGACGLPDGAVTLVESALGAFADDLEVHRRHGHCGRPAAQIGFPGLETRGGRLR